LKALEISPDRLSDKAFASFIKRKTVLQKCFVVRNLELELN